MTATLRERRRLQTIREIQLAALRLCLSVGYANVTTDLIAAEAGISPRTFFNYYPNKQAAILGETPELGCVCIRWPRLLDGSLTTDLARLVGSILGQMHLDRDVVCMVEEICHDTPELSALIDNSMNTIALIIGQLLEQRLGPERRSEAMLVAQLTTGALSRSIRVWAADEAMTLKDISQMVEHMLAHVGDLLR
ncbi:TetR family transcriptional regulator (plasmid) [Paracoccus liaowanqingii]|uniref:TetR family transcriptional regulator n=1 Tax=Paracoccus liaowanqingii TaxID=2560053 RepID=A0A4Y5SR54_9RHOB|nr:TetR/AcrR family transcriptional regulator [Paracoccus liaowanqingii]QDA35829.1 TetR family transcriptional regulator [Paracoccus liaowanqingii]